MSEKTLRAKLRTFAVLKDGFYQQRFAADMSQLLRMNHRLRFDERFAQVHSNLFEYMDDDIPCKVVIPRGKWDTGTGSLVVKTMLRGLCY